MSEPDLATPWDQDPICLALIAEHPDGVPLCVIAKAYKRDINAIWQTEKAALRKLAQIARLRELLREAQDEEAECWSDLEW